jgi:hypothetical protein
MISENAKIGYFEPTETGAEECSCEAVLTVLDDKDSRILNKMSFLIVDGARYELVD